MEARHTPLFRVRKKFTIFCGQCEPCLECHSAPTEAISSPMPI